MPQASVSQGQYRICTFSTLIFAFSKFNVIDFDLIIQFLICEIEAEVQVGVLEYLKEFRWNFWVESLGWIRKEQENQEEMVKKN